MRCTVSLGLSFALVGCLFPSFDELREKTPPANEQPIVTSAESTTEPPAPPPATVIATKKPVVACGDLSCDLSTTVCCFDVLWQPSCAEPSEECFGGKLPCDDDDDCSSGQSCCGDPDSFDTVCRSGGCGNDEHVCEPDREAAQCGAGTTCTGTLYMTLPKPGTCR